LQALPPTFASTFTDYSAKASEKKINKKNYKQYPALYLALGPVSLKFIRASK
jgi:hypothetical protein